MQGETPLGIQARRYIDAGDFVPDSVTNHMVRERLAAPDVEDGFLLDGYPRTSTQVDYLEELLTLKEQRLDVVLQLTADDDVLVARLLERATKAGRSDDTEAVIQHRIDLYHEETEAVVAKYATLGILVQVDGNGPLDEVTRRVLLAIDGAIAYSAAP